MLLGLKKCSTDENPYLILSAKANVCGWQGNRHWLGGGIAIVLLNECDVPVQLFSKLCVWPQMTVAVSSGAEGKLPVCTYCRDLISPQALRTTVLTVME